MAMNMAGSAGGGGRRGRRRAAVMAEINVTPMVDVMLVLLIIFMVAAPLMTSTIDIDLPVAGGGKSLAANSPPLTLSVKRTGGTCNSNVELYLGDTLISANDLLPKIKAIRETRSEAERVVYLRGDKDVCYTDMMKLLGYIREAGRLTAERESSSEDQGRRQDTDCVGRPARPRAGVGDGVCLDQGPRNAAGRFGAGRCDFFQ
jgi:biopolymer transport protein TolR